MIQAAVLAHNEKALATLLKMSCSKVHRNMRTQGLGSCLRRTYRRSLSRALLRRSSTR
jgi:hypothetical protein